MKAIFGILGLLLVVAIVGVLARKQLSAGVAPSVPGATATAPAATPKQQVDQFQQAVQGAMQQTPRTTPDDTK